VAHASACSGELQFAVPQGGAGTIACGIGCTACDGRIFSIVKVTFSGIFAASRGTEHGDFGGVGNGTFARAA